MSPLHKSEVARPASVWLLPGDELEQPSNVHIRRTSCSGEFESFEVHVERRVLLAFLVGDVVAEATDAVVADVPAAEGGDPYEAALAAGQGVGDFCRTEMISSAVWSVSAELNVSVRT